MLNLSTFFLLSSLKQKTVGTTLSTSNVVVSINSKSRIVYPLIHSFFIFQNNSVAMSVQTALTGVLYNKSLTISGRGRSKFPNGKIMNLVASDAFVIQLFFTYVHDTIMMPIEIAALSILIILYLGAAGAIGLAFVIGCVALNSLVLKNSITYETAALKATDERVNLTSEVLSAIKIVKFFSWETAFQSRIQKSREKEIAIHKVLRFISASFAGMMNLIPTFTNLIMFGVYWVLGNTLSPSTVFTALSVINLLRLPVAIFPMVAQ
jgi:ABC-type multidrug transport system fused ATPase/permease subunit